MRRAFWNHYAGGLLAIVALLTVVYVACATFTPQANAGLRCQYVVEKTQANRSIEQANLNTAASAGYKLAQLTAAQTVLVKCS